MEGCGDAELKLSLWTLFCVLTFQMQFHSPDSTASYL